MDKRRNADRRCGFRISQTGRLIIFALIMALAAFAPAPAQVTVFSSGANGSGADWTAGATWLGGNVPDSTMDVVIVSGDSIYTPSATAVKCNNLTIQSGARLNVQGTSGSGGLTAKGAFEIDADGWFYNSHGSLSSFPLAASYVIDPASYYVQTSSASSTMGKAGYDSTFGNVINLKSGSTAAANLTINGDLIINTGAAGNTFRGTNATVNLNLTHVVHGNVTVISGQWSAVDGGNDLTAIWNVDGNVTVGSPTTGASMARMGPLTSASSTHRLGIFNIGGNLAFVNGARLQAASSTSSTTTSEVGIINVKGNFSMDSTCLMATNSIGIFALNFTGSGTQIVALKRPFSLSSSTMQPQVFDTVATGAAVVFANPGGETWSIGSTGTGSWVVDGSLSLGPLDTLKGPQAFALNAGGTLNVGSPYGLQVTDSLSNIQVKGTRTFSTGANYTFSGTAAQVTGDGLPATVHNLSVMSIAGLSLTNDVEVTGQLLAANGRLLLGSKSVVAAAAVSAGPMYYVVTDGAGVLRIPSVGSTETAFPVGTTDGYAPVWVTNGAAPDTFTVSVQPDTAAAAGGGRVNARWTIAESNGGASTCTLKFGWVGALESPAFAGDRAGSAKIYLLDGTPVEAGSGDYTTQLLTEPYTTARGGVTALGNFGVGKFVATSVRDEGPVPLEFRLYHNYPNPFNPSTTVEFTVLKKGPTTLIVYNMLGQLVATLFNDEAIPGVRYTVRFDGSGLASGVYFTRLENNGNHQIQKMMLTK